MSNRHPDDEKLDQVLQILMEASSAKKMSIKDYISKIYEKVKDTEDQAVNKVKEKALKIDEHAHKKPWIYIAGAALGGLFLGLICHRNRH